MSEQWTVQAYTTGLGWVDVRYADHRTEAEQEAQRLRMDDNAWMSGTTHRRVRIVPRRQSRTELRAYRYAVSQ